jgi:hypothetical protein
MNSQVHWGEVMALLGQKRNELSGGQITDSQNAARFVFAPADPLTASVISRWQQNNQTILPADFTAFLQTFGTAEVFGAKVHHPDQLGVIERGHQTILTFAGRAGRDLDVLFGFRMTTAKPSSPVDGSLPFHGRKYDVVIVAQRQHAGQVVTHADRIAGEFAGWLSALHNNSAKLATRGRA